MSDEPIIVDGKRKEPGAKLRIVQPSISPHSTRVWLNDQEITHCLESMSLAWCPDEVTTAMLTIGIREVEMDAQTLVNLIARMEDPAMIEEAIRTLKRAKADLE